VPLYIYFRTFEKQVFVVSVGTLSSVLLLAGSAIVGTGYDVMLLAAVDIEIPDVATVGRLGLATEIGSGP